MRMLFNIRFPHEKFNAAVRDGSAGATIQRILEALNPEAVYFTEKDGHRACTLVAQVEKASDIPMYAEPWFLNFDADVEFRIAMTPEDLERANLGSLGEQWK